MAKSKVSRKKPPAKVAVSEPTKVVMSENIRFLDILAEQAIKAWLAGKHKKAFMSFGILRAEDAAYVSVRILAGIGDSKNVDAAVQFILELRKRAA